jgi:hypothetical protein
MVRFPLDRRQGTGMWCSPAIETIASAVTKVSNGFGALGSPLLFREEHAVPDVVFQLHRSGEPANCGSHATTEDT